ncbi:helix-turn-helix transcriptional regulator [Serratia entomophila]|uniref:helix-turn-helix transcriptional regulator n=1 Tax=Serratia entomophila TaxID=42906 RepID=UPI0021776614|nr:YafY family protein [Serratia entomophila]CAI0837992.1 HTH domain [Serratia entomophila]CAI1540013.1 HTH domain [Serratia entomophila]CAI1556493.1 HTH domain [Serratia entomophila]CAI1706192.1 HTH domain [Serratia entomophila]CAI1938674.1 HTH domain [Serratia entomophila]
MRRSDRLFEIIQLLRSATRALTAASMAASLEVTVRTLYRDIAALQARRVPIEGAPGVGYVLRRGFDLPPLMFTLEEVEAISVGVRLLRRTGDAGLQQAAESVLSKVTVILPQVLRENLAASTSFVSDFGATVAPAVDLSAIRDAIRTSKKLCITYRDEQGKHSRRRVWPLAIAYYVQATLIAGWCELRNDYRHFRTDRIINVRVLDEVFPTDEGRLLQGWLARSMIKTAAP